MSLVHEETILNWPLMPRIHPDHLGQGVKFFNFPDLYDPLRSGGCWVLHTAATGDKMLICVHDLGINVQARVLLLQNESTLGQHVVKQQVTFSVEQQHIVIGEIPGGVESFKFFNLVLFSVNIFFDDLGSVGLMVTEGEGERGGSLQVFGHCVEFLLGERGLDFFLE